MKHTMNENIILGEVSVDAFDVRSAVIRGQRRVVFFDTLTRSEDMQELLPGAQGRDVVVVYSHADWDHIWGTGALPGAPLVIAHQAALERFAAEVPRELETMRRDEPGKYDGVTLIPPSITFDSTLTLDLGAVSLELHSLPGHTTDSIVGFVPEEGALLMGDAVETPFPVVNHPELLPPWIAALTAWERDERVRRVIPSHGPVGGREILTKNIEYLQALQRGAPAPPAGDAAPFYVETHERNVRLCSGKA